MSRFGKYRATVLSNADPEQRGRLQLVIPDVFGELPSPWAEACVPLAGPPGLPMGVAMIPANGTAVWVEFERGNISYPIWTGCRWDSTVDIPADVKAGLPTSPNIVMQTTGQNQVVISDLPPTPISGGIMLQSAANAMIVVNESGIYITNGRGASITLVGPVVSINDGALAVT